MDESKSPNYFAWAIATAAGVLIAHFAIREYEIYKVKQALIEFTRATERRSASMQRQIEESRRQALEATERRRIESESKKHAEISVRRIGDPMGRHLSQQCDDWTRLAEGMRKSEYALQEKVKFCGQLEVYVNQGTPPRR